MIVQRARMTSISKGMQTSRKLRAASFLTTSLLTRKGNNRFLEAQSQRKSNGNGSQRARFFACCGRAALRPQLLGVVEQNELAAQESVQMSSPGKIGIF